MIDLDDVHLTLTSAAGPVDILKGVDLAVPAGTTASLVGPSGSGKSSLMAVVGGIERPTTGRVRIDGVDTTDLSEDDLASFRRGRVGILFQSFHLIPTMTALENVAVPLELMGRRDAFPRAREALAEVGLGHRTDHYPSQMSGGEQQRAALARAFVAEPRLLLADEPTGNLDRRTGAEVIELLFRLQGERGTTLLVITHDAGLAARAGTRFAVRDGQVFPEQAFPEDGRLAAAEPRAARA